MVALHGLHPQLATTMPMRTARQRHPPRQRWLYSTAAPLLPPTASSPDATLDVGGAGFHHVTPAARLALAGAPKDDAVGLAG